MNCSENVVQDTPKDRNTKTADRKAASRQQAQYLARRWGLPVTLIALGLGGVMLGVWGFYRYGRIAGEPDSSWDILYLTLQLFTLESGAVGDPVPWQLEVARIIAPMATAGTVFAALARLFRDPVLALRLWFSTGHVIICGLNRKGSQLVHDYRAAGHRVVVIEEDEGNAAVQTARDQNALVVIGDATDRSLLRKVGVRRAKSLLAVCNDDGANVEIVVRAFQIRQNGDKPQLPKLCCYVHVVDLDLCRLFQLHPIFTTTTDPFEVRIFNTHENSARLLMRDHSLDRDGIGLDDPHSVHLAILGFGWMGQSIALQAARMAHYANGKVLRITAIDHEAESRRCEFFGRFPQFPNVCHVEFVAGKSNDAETLRRVAGLAAEPDTLLTVAICLDHDSRSLSSALGMMTELRTYEAPILVRMNEEAGLATLLERADSFMGCKDSSLRCMVHPFGMIQAACSLERVTENRLDDLAKQIHAAYLDQRKGEEHDGHDDSNRPWDELAYEFQESCRQQADHIPVKLRAIRCRAVPLEDRAGQPQEEFAFRPGEIELLAEMEHRRWMVGKSLDGWTEGARDDQEKRNPHLIAWDKLSEEIQDRDRRFVREIPALLARVGKRISRGQQ